MACWCPYPFCLLACGTVLTSFTLLSCFSICVFIRDKRKKIQNILLWDNQVFGHFAFPLWTVGLWVLYNLSPLLPDTFSQNTKTVGDSACLAVFSFNSLIISMEHLEILVGPSVWGELQVWDTNPPNQGCGCTGSHVGTEICNIDPQTFTVRAVFDQLEQQVLASNRKYFNPFILMQPEE